MGITSMYMHGAEFGAAMQRRDGFAGIQQAFCVEGLFQRMKLGQFGAGKLQAHVIDLFPRRRRVRR